MSQLTYLSIITMSLIGQSSWSQALAPTPKKGEARIKTACFLILNAIGTALKFATIPIRAGAFIIMTTALKSMATGWTPITKASNWPSKGNGK